LPFEEEDHECVKCEVCGLECDDARSYRRHMETVCGKREDLKERMKSQKEEAPVVMECNTCGMKFGRLRNLRRHTSRNNCSKKRPRSKGKQIFSCLESKCGMEFYRKSDLVLHNAEKHPDKAEKDCDVNAINLDEDEEEEADEEKEKSPFQCSYCPKICQGFGHKSRHERTHLTKYKCKIHNCDASFNVLGKFLGHMDKFHDIILGDEEEVERYMNSESGAEENKPTNITDEESRVQPPVPTDDIAFGTPKLFEGKKNMRERRARNGEQPPFKCEHCPKTFGKFSHRNRHELTHSGNPKPYKCEMDGCTMSFSRRENLRRHLDSHVPEELRPKFKCPYPNCSEEFLYMKGLKSHKALHENGLMYSCKICMQSFGKKWKLNRHLSDKHGHLKPFSCTFEGCNHRFVRKSQVQGHIRKQHILHYCFEEECGSLQPFGTRGEMYKHNKKFHPAPRLHLVCGDCGRVCYTKSGFSRHQLWHQRVEEKERQLEKEEFVCDYPFCATVCTSKEELSGHIGEKHLGANRKKKSRSCTCRICNTAFENDIALAKHLEEDHEISGDRNIINSGEQVQLEEEEDMEMDIVYMDTSEVDEEEISEKSDADDDSDDSNEEEESGARSGDIPGSPNRISALVNAGALVGGEIEAATSDLQTLMPESLAVPPAHELFPTAAAEEDFCPLARSMRC